MTDIANIKKLQSAIERSRYMIDLQRIHIYYPRKAYKPFLLFMLSIGALIYILANMGGLV